MFRAPLPLPLPHQPKPVRPLAPVGHRARAAAVVVPLDGTSLAERALPAALAIARRWNAELRLVQARALTPQANLEDLTLADNGESMSFRWRSDSYLQGLVARLDQQGDVRVTTATIAGRSAAEALADECAARARLVVIAPRSRSALARMWRGSVAEHLRRQSKVPLLIVPPAVRNQRQAAEPKFERMLLPINERPLSSGVVAHALAIAGDAPTEFCLLRVIPLWALAQSHRAGGGSTVPVGSLAAALRNEAWFRLGDVRRRLEGLQRNVETRVVFDNLSPGASIVAHAGAIQADLIALTVRRRFLPAWLRSSIADYVAAHSPVPVLLCPAG